MIKGLYAAFTAMESSWRYYDLLSNNIANVSTPGYKREIASNQAFGDILLSRQTPTVSPLSSRIQDVVGQIGTGKLLTDFTTDFTQGTFQTTGNEFDLGTDRGFFAVQTPDGNTFYTRDGRFSRDSEGTLVTSHGYFVLNADGGRISLPAESVSVDPDGVISREGEVIDQIRVLDFAPGQLARAGEAFFSATGEGTQVTGGVRQGILELSNATLIDDLTTLLTVHRAYQANQTVLAKLDITLDQAAGQLGIFGR